MQLDPYIIALARCESIGSVYFSRLTSHLGTAQAVWAAGRTALLATGLGEKTTDFFLSERATIDPARECERMEKEGVRAVCKDDAGYPTLLREIYDAPFILFYRGVLPQSDRILLAVVGTRRLTPYGMQITPSLVGELAKNAIGIISGLALGIDALAHRATLDVGGYTLAVCANGVDHGSVYPRHNAFLADEIIEKGGALVSEHPVGVHPLPRRFPLRNRIVAGMSRGVLVIEAPEVSGALITARLALENGRDVFAIPGPITYPTCRGTNALLRAGASVVLRSRDVLDAFDLAGIAQAEYREPVRASGPTEATLFALLSSQPIHVDELSRACRLDIQTVNSTLVLMEMKGLAKNIGMMMYVKV